MPTLTIDGRTITVPEGATILQGARALGIDIPTLCYYPTLPVVGNCRICLVSVEGAPKLAPACAIQVSEGMRVDTRSVAAQRNRESVLGMLLDRFPAPHVGANGARTEFDAIVERYAAPLTRRSGLPPRGGDPRDGDPVIQHDMSSCILCTRCVRACEDIQVVGVLEMAHRGAHAEIIVGADGNPEHAGCTWCGECVRVCPTGAIHDIVPLAQRAAHDANGGISAPHAGPPRRAAVDAANADRSVRSVCPYCAVGCQIDLKIRDNRIVRVESPWIEEPTPNMGSTCVKGRFGTDFVQHRDRLTVPLIRRGWVKEGGRWRFDA